MASEELLNKVSLAEQLIKQNGYKQEYADALFQYGRYILDTENDRENGLRALSLAKGCLDGVIHEQTGADFWELLKYCKKNDVTFDVLTLYYDILLVEARNHVLDSYFIYLEKKRVPKEMFYLPKRRHFIKLGIIQGLQDMLDDKLDILTISMPPSTQKCQPLYSKVLTPNGFVQMGDIHVGSKVVSASGKVATVLSQSEVKKRPIYELTFDDGSKCRASDNHLWRVQTRDDRRRGNKYRIVETKDMLKNLYVENGKRSNYSVDYVGKIDIGKSKDFVIHPYILGVILGDGGLSDGQTNISTVDDQILGNVNLLLPKGYDLCHKDRCTYFVRGHEGNNAKCGSLVTKELKRLGLYKSRSEDKFIPTEYLNTSYDQRLELLQGLLDTDGSASKTYCSYSTVSEQLAKDVVWLVHSLGGYASSNIRHAGYRKNGEYIQCKDYYEILIQFTAESDKLFKLDRKNEKYHPRRKTIKRFIRSIEYVGEEDCKCILISDPSHLYITDDFIVTHNTTCEKFFASGIMGWFPEEFSLFFSHSADITRMFYDGVLDIISNTDEYAWAEIFPDAKITSTNAKTESITINKYKPFANLQNTSRGSSNAGKVRVSGGGFLYVDDLISKIEEALNKDYLDKLWGVYSVDARQRKMDGAKEIHIATRWSVHDVIGRLQRLYEGNDRCRFIAVPDIDPVTGKSNFDYEFNGFTENFFHDQELAMDEISYKCLYKNDPIEREGLLYHDDELRRFVDLPTREPDAILAVCDTKSKGSDFLVMPIMYQYDNDYYMVDCICSDDSNYGVQYGRMANMLLSHGVQQCEFESNAGGDRVAYEVEQLVKDNGGRCNITTKPTETNKETRIIVNADWVKKNCLFKIKDDISPRTDYHTFMSWLLSYSVVGKNTHDDVPDCMANFALFVQAKFNIRKAVIRRSPI